MIAALLAIIGPKLAAYISAAIAAVLGVLVYGGSQRRKGRMAERQKATAKAAQDEAATIERIHNATAGSIDADTARRVLAERDAKR